MKKITLTILLLAFLTLGFSQNGSVVSGRIFDHESNMPLPFATITLKSLSRIIGGTISKEDGRFSISGISKGQYSITCSFVGYEEKEISLLIGVLNNTYDLGKIQLIPTSESLDEVIVKVKKEILSSGLDKKTFAIENNIAQSGGSVMDAMKTMPGITVDQEGKVMLRGSDKVSVLIDGKQSSLTGFGSQKGLESIPAANIANIEIINNPSAKYDASGMAGIINIIYKKEKGNGFNGDINFSYGLGALSKPKPDLPNDLGSFSLNPKYLPSLNLNYKTSKIHLFLSPEVMFLRKLPNNEFTTRTYDNGSRTVSQVPENRRQKHYIVNGGMDWFLNNNNTLTIAGIYDWEIHVDTAQVPFINMDDWKRYRFWQWNEKEITGYMNYSLHYNHKFPESGHSLDARIQYTKGWEDESYFLNDSSSVRQGKDDTHILAIEHTTNLTVDYVKPLKSGRMESGMKGQWRRLPVEYSIIPGSKSIIYPNMGDWSDWGEDIYSAYINYIYEKPMYDLEGGLRGEYTNVFYTIAPENIYYPRNDSYSYFELFPNIRLTLKINQSNSLSAFFNRRVDRPGEAELRIFPKYDDPELLKVGNPYLRPQFTNSFELSYKYKWQSGSIFFSGYQRKIQDAFQRIYSIDNSNSQYSIVNKIYENTGTVDNIGIEFIFSQQVMQAWKFSGSINFYINKINAFEGTMYFPYERPFSFEANSDKTWDFKLNNQIDLSNGLKFQVTGVYYAPKYIPQGKQMARSSIDLGIKRNFMNGKVEINFSFSDIFNNFGIRQEINGDGFTALYENYFETQVARLGFKYKF